MIGARAAVDLSPAEGLAKGGLRKCLRVGVNRAASPVKAAVVSSAEAVRRTGATAKAIRIKTKLYPAERFAAIIGPSRKYLKSRGRYKRGNTPGAARFIKPAKYAHLVEKGTHRSKARPFLKPAHDATAPAFLSQCGYEVGREIERELIRRAAR